MVDRCQQVSVALTCEKNQGSCAYHFESQVMEFIDAWAKIEGKQDVKLCQHHTLHIHLVVHYHHLECTYTHYNIKKRSENYSWVLQSIPGFWGSPHPFLCVFLSVVAMPTHCNTNSGVAQNTRKGCCMKSTCRYRRTKSFLLLQQDRRRRLRRKR